jgi:phosphoribosylformimino-5-aminoimidazole carboxamide ribotide isomerase
MPSSFELLPAIDLVEGRVVRLERGDFRRETRYGVEPVEVAMRFIAAGAKWLHVVDLDGARAGEPRQQRAIAAVIEAVGDRAAVEVAGGLRSESAIGSVLAIGAARAVIGTAGLLDPGFTATAVGGHGADRIAIAVDVRAGMAIGEGWRDGAVGRPVMAAVAAAEAAGVTTFEVTAVERDGLSGGPDLALLGSVVGPGRSIIASGGVASIADLVSLRELGCSGAIVGRALYEGAFGLEAALEAIGG